MLFNEIELPDEIPLARDEGNLVIFAGAGVSCGSPSSLPLFEGLVEKIAVNSAATRGENETLDGFLGRLGRGGTKVHHLAASILLNPESHPNVLHGLLLRLFGKPESIKLVTTNFDRHFTTEGKTRWSDSVREYYAPALPRGDCFHGIVYLHGAAFIDPEECVLTDEDFGRAYLTEAWATRFLKDMFGRYTVLFIGYSHNDLVMTYLARGLPPSTRRFALHDSADNTRWAHLGITQVRYPAEVANHSSLTHFFQTWVQELESGLAESYQRLTQLCGDHPEALSSEDADFVRRRLSEEDSVKRFQNAARDPRWIAWLERKGLISQLLQVNGEVDPVQGQMARWLATSFLEGEQEALLSLLERRSGRIHQCLWFHIAANLLNARRPVSDVCFRKWIRILLSGAPDSSFRISDLVLAASRRRDTESLLLLIERLITPRIRQDKSFFLRDGEMVATTVNTLNLLHDDVDYWVNEAWEQILKPEILTLAPKLDIIVRRLLWLADVLVRESSKSPDFDPLGFARPDIEVRTRPPQYAFDFLIDVAIAVIRSRIETSPADSVAYLNELFATEIRVLQRLAIAGMRMNPTFSADQKLRWLLSKRVLYALWCRAEVLKFLDSTIGSSSGTIKSETLKSVMSGPEPGQKKGLSEKQVDSLTYSLLRSLKRLDESWQELDSPLAELLKRYPDFEEEVAPFEPPIVSPGAQWGTPTDEFNLDDVVDAAASKFLDQWLDEREDSIREWRYGAVLPALAKRSMGWFLDLVKTAVERKESQGFVWASIERAVREAKRTDDNWREMLELANTATESGIARYFAIRLLELGITADDDPLPPMLFESADRLADRLTEDLIQSAEPFELGDDWLFTAINHPVCWLWHYWVERGVKWKKMPGGEPAVFELVTRNLSRLLGENWIGAPIARIRCGSQVAILDYLDSNFARTKVVPLFSWSRNEEAALHAWSGFLQSGRWSVALKDLVLEDLIITAQRWQRLPEASMHALGPQLAILAVLVVDDPLNQEMLSRCIRPLPDDVLETFARTISQILRGLKRDAAESIWRRWLLEYLRQRSLGLPKPLTAGEIQQVPIWALYAGSYFPNAVAAFKEVSRGQTFEVIDWVLAEIEEHPEVFAHSEACAELILAVTNNTPDGLADPPRFLRVIEQIKSTGVPQEIGSALDERMVRLGFN
jgi:hypothetical protein